MKICTIAAYTKENITHTLHVTPCDQLMIFSTQM